MIAVRAAGRVRSRSGRRPDALRAQKAVDCGGTQTPQLKVLRHEHKGTVCNGAMLFSVQGKDIASDVLAGGGGGGEVGGRGTGETVLKSTPAASAPAGPNTEARTPTSPAPTERAGVADFVAPAPTTAPALSPTVAHPHLYVGATASLTTATPAFGGAAGVTTASVGLIATVMSDVVYIEFPRFSAFMARPDEVKLVPSSISDTSIPDVRIGSRVRVRKSVEKPQFGWGGGVSHDSVGTVVRMEPGHVRVDFPTLPLWVGKAEELELAVDKAEVCRVGARVRVRGSVTSPRYKWGSRGVDHFSTGHVTKVDGDKLLVNMRTSRGDMVPWWAHADEMEVSPGVHLVVGATVAVREDVTQPRYNWGSRGVKHGVHGVLSAIEGLTKARVDFPNNPGWHADLCELQVIRTCPILTGSRVRVQPQAGAREPKFGWGGASASDVGVLMYYVGTIAYVRFEKVPAFRSPVWELVAV